MGVTHSSSSSSPLSAPLSIVLLVFSQLFVVPLFPILWKNHHTTYPWKYRSRWYRGIMCGCTILWSEFSMIWYMTSSIPCTLCLVITFLAPHLLLLTSHLHGITILTRHMITYTWMEQHLTREQTTLAQTTAATSQTPMIKGGNDNMIPIKVMVAPAMTASSQPIHHRLLLRYHHYFTSPSPYLLLIPLTCILTLLTIIPLLATSITQTSCDQAQAWNIILFITCGMQGAGAYAISRKGAQYQRDNFGQFSEYRFLTWSLFLLTFILACTHLGHSHMSLTEIDILIICIFIPCIVIIGVYGIPKFYGRRERVATSAQKYRVTRIQPCHGYEVPNKSNSSENNNSHSHSHSHSNQSASRFISSSSINVRSQPNPYVHDELDPSQITCHTLLSHPQGYSSFLAFLRTEWSVAPVFLWKSITSFKSSSLGRSHIPVKNPRLDRIIRGSRHRGTQLSRKHAVRLASQVLDIYQRYLRIDAPCYVPLPNAISTPLISKIKLCQYMTSQATQHQHQRESELKKREKQLYAAAAQCAVIMSPNVVNGGAPCPVSPSSRPPPYRPDYDQKTPIHLVTEIADIFNEAQKLIYQEMHDQFLRYLSSSYYRDLVANCSSNSTHLRGSFSDEGEIRSISGSGSGSQGHMHAHAPQVQPAAAAVRTSSRVSVSRLTHTHTHTTIDRMGSLAPPITRSPSNSSLDLLSQPSSPTHAVRSMALVIDTATVPGMNSNETTNLRRATFSASNFATLHFNTSISRSTTNTTTTSPSPTANHTSNNRSRPRLATRATPPISIDATIRTLNDEAMVIIGNETSTNVPVTDSSSIPSSSSIINSPATCSVPPAAASTLISPPRVLSLSPTCTSSGSSSLAHIRRSSVDDDPELIQRWQSKQLEPPSLVQTKDAITEQAEKQQKWKRRTFTKSQIQQINNNEIQHTNTTIKTEEIPMGEDNCKDKYIHDNDNNTPPKDEVRIDMDLLQGLPRSSSMCLEDVTG